MSSRLRSLSKKFGFLAASSSSDDDGDGGPLTSAPPLASSNTIVVHPDGADESPSPAAIEHVGLEYPGADTAAAVSSEPAVEEGDVRPSLTSRIATGIFGAVERLMFGNNDHDPSFEGSAVESISTAASPRRRYLPSHESKYHPSPSSATTSSRDVVVHTVAIDDPHIAWAKRHAHRLHQRSGVFTVHAPTDHHMISRFANAIVAHDQYDDDDDPHAHSAFASGRGTSRHPGYHSARTGQEPYHAEESVVGGSGTARGIHSGATWAPNSASIAVELASAVDAYRSAPNEYYGSIVQAALAQRGPDDPVVGPELRRAAGNPYLMQLILASGALDCADVENQQIVQHEIDLTLRAKEHTSTLSRLSSRRSSSTADVSKPHLPRLDPSAATYLKMLFLLPSSRVTKEQVTLLENSGFEFIKLLHDYPHILNDLPKAPWWQLKPYKEHRHLDLMASILGMAVMLLDMGCLIAIAVHWWQTRTSFGYWTALMTLGGYVMTLIMVVVFESSKVDSSFYDERLGEYPSSNVKMVPIVPLLEMMLVFNIVRYYIASRREGRAFFIVTHDLHASFAQLFILHSQCHSFPQLLLQNYLFSWGSFNVPSYIAFNIFVVTSSISCCASLLLFLRRIACFRSVNGAGYSVFGAVGSEANFASRAEFFPKIITFILIYMLEYNAFFLIVAVMNISDCSTTVLVWVGVVGLIIVAVVIILVYSLAKGKSSSTTGKLALGPLIAQIAFAIYGSIFSNTQSSESCTFYSFTLGANVRVGIAAFSLMLSVWVAWVLVTVHRRYVVMDATLTFAAKIRWLLFSHDKHATPFPKPRREGAPHGPEEDTTTDTENSSPPVEPPGARAGVTYSTDGSPPITPEASALQHRLPQGARTVMVG